MAGQSTQFELAQRSIRISQLVGEPQEQVEADWNGPSLQRVQSNEIKGRPRLSQMMLHRSSSSGTLRHGKSTAHADPAKTSPKPKLPSFEQLGIAGPHLSNEAPKSEQKGSDLGHVPTSYFQRSPSRSQTSPIPGFLYGFGSMPLLTPPEDSDSVKCNGTPTPANVSPPEESSATESRVSSLFTQSLASNSQSSAESASSARPSESQSNAPPLNDVNQPPAELETNQDRKNWLNKAVRKTVESTNSSNRLGQSMKVVFQFQPCPSDQASQPGSVFQSIVNDISNHHGSTHTPNIEIFHAVPQDFSLRNLPTSPPTTPNASAGGDYFTSQIFGSATVIQPHHNHNGVLLAHPPSVSTFVRPPSSVSVSILERLIPPASANEYIATFSSRNSALADRLVELSPYGGSIMFIYPTNRGAQSFRDDLLGPILDPLLRNIVSLNSLYTDLGASLGRLSSVSSMLSFSGMLDKLQALCRTISEQAYPRDVRSRFELLYAGKGKVALPRTLWTELFLKQERPRLRELLEGYWSRGRRLPRNADVTSATLLREIIDGLVSRPYSEGPPVEEVEVGAFVIRRSLV